MIALVPQLQARPRSHGDDARRLEVDALGRVTEEHRQRAFQHDEHLLLRAFRVAPPAGMGRIAPEPRTRLRQLARCGQVGDATQLSLLVRTVFPDVVVGPDHKLYATTIDGLILRGGVPKRVLFRAIGPELNGVVAGALQDPAMELHGENGALLMSNDNWREAPNANDIEATGLAPKDDRESAILLTLPPANYTTIVRGVKNTTGIALNEAYKLP